MLVAGLLLSGFGLRLVLTPFPVWPVPLAAYVALLVGAGLYAAWVAAGREGVRWLGGPLIVLAGALPWPSLIEGTIIAPLRVGLANLAAEVCYGLGVSALAQGTTLRLAQTWVGVDETCGGMRSLQATVLAALFLGEWLRLGWTRRGALVVVALGAAVAGNFLRILVLVWRADVGGEEALQAAHDGAGWFSLASSLLLLGLAARLMARGKVGAAAQVVSRRGGAGWGTVPVAFVVLAGGLGLGEVATRIWYERGAARVAEQFPQWQVGFPARAAGYRTVPLPDAAREILGPDYFAAAEWRDAEDRMTSVYYVEWRRGQAARSVPFLHNPTVCLPLSGCEYVRPAGDLVVRWAGGEIPFARHVFRRAGEEFSVAFVLWDPARGRPLRKIEAGRAGWLAAQFADVREAREHQPAQLLTVAAWGPRAEERLTGIVSALIVAAPDNCSR
jgi:exosortase/archaeosortase family protein